MGNGRTGKIPSRGDAFLRSGAEGMDTHYLSGAADGLGKGRPGDHEKSLSEGTADQLTEMPGSVNGCV